MKNIKKIILAAIYLFAIPTLFYCLIEPKDSLDQSIFTQNTLLMSLVVLNLLTVMFAGAIYGLGVVLYSAFSSMDSNSHEEQDAKNPTFDKTLVSPAFYILASFIAMMFIGMLDQLFEKNQYAALDTKMILCFYVINFFSLTLLYGANMLYEAIIVSFNPKSININDPILDDHF